MEVATARSGRPSRMTWPACRPISARTCRRSWRTWSVVGGSLVSQSRVSRLAPSGSEMATSGSSSTPSAISSDPPPMSRISSLPEDQPNQRRAARNVSRASSWPDRTWMCASLSSRIWASTSSALAASRTAEVANASSSSTPLSSAIWSASRTKARSCRAPSSESRVPPSRWSPSRSSDFMGVGGGGPRTAVRVNHQEVNRVGAHVQHTESHTLTLLGSTRRQDRDPCTGGRHDQDRGTGPHRDRPQAGPRLPWRRDRRGHPRAGPGLGMAVLPGVLLPGRRRAGQADPGRGDGALAEPGRRRDLSRPGAGRDRGAGRAALP